MPSYYPYGLIMTNSAIATPSQPNLNLYNGGSEWQKDYGDLPDLYQTFYRSYDAALGSFTGIDPMAEKFNSLSPYHYAGNNPIMNNDPLGDDFTQQDWDNAMHALRYSRDGASIGEGGFIRYYTSAKDAQYTAAAAMTVPEAGVIQNTEVFATLAAPWCIIMAEVFTVTGVIYDMVGTMVM